uniref:Neurotransmitter-gated ion-channel ligand-binding domain-containing protein n=1 Tax=Strigamia maritima TaxID=126957 RepID=T1JJ38_STRMM
MKTAAACWWCCSYWTALFLLPWCASAYRPKSLNISSMLDSVLRHYDKRVRPNYGGSQSNIASNGDKRAKLLCPVVLDIQIQFHISGAETSPPVEVAITMYILGFSSVSEIDMDFTIDFYFRQFWSDERLMVASPDWDSQLSVGADVINQIWIPDTFFVNEKKAYFHNATTPNSFLRIGSDGRIIRSM